MYRRLNNCPSCGNKDHENYLITKDYFLSQEDFHLSKCTQCQLVFTNPIPTSERLSEYYSSDQYLSHHTGLDLMSFVYQILRLYNLRYKHSVIKTYLTQPEEMTLLDYGCGTGSFLKSCKKKYSKIIGIEPDHDARQKASHDDTIKVLSNLDKLDSKDKFYVITLWHVLEHVENLNETIAIIRSHLKKNGRLFIAVPNIDSYEAKSFRSYWAALDVPRHLYHFNTVSIKDLMKRHRFRLIGTEPLKLDAYYISLQSIFYRDKKKNIWKAIKSGFISNEEGENTGNFSSNIYVFEKY